MENLDIENQEEIFDHLKEISVKTKFDSWVISASQWIAWLLIVIMGISTYEVFMRYVLNKPTNWVHETTILLVAVIFSLGGAYTLALGRHIRVNLIYDYLQEGGKLIVDIINSLITAMFCFVLAYIAFLMLRQSVFAPDGSWYLERSGSAWNPPFPPIVRFSIFLATAVMSLQAVLHVFYFVRKYRDLKTMNNKESGQ